MNVSRHSAKRLRSAAALRVAFGVAVHFAGVLLSRAPKDTANAGPACESGD